jgi:hypothetical protein
VINGRRPRIAIGHQVCKTSHSRRCLTRKAAILKCLDPISSTAVGSLLADHIKPLFTASPHPMINLESGRGLSKPAGGPHAGFHMFVTQPWKNNLGICSVLAFAIQCTRSSDYESLWPLIIPPMMTILDDHSAKWRLRSIPTARGFVERAPSEMLRRTGLQDLLFKVNDS